MLKTIGSSFQMAISNIRANFLHTMLSVLGIVIGVASLVAILSLIDGMEKFAREQIAKTTSLNAISLSSIQYKLVNDVRIRKDSLEPMTYNEMKELRNEFEDRATVKVLRQTSEEVSAEGNEKLVGVEFAATIEDADTELKYLKGIPFSKTDIETSSKTTVVNAAFVKLVNWTYENAVGRKIHTKLGDLFVKGVVASAENEAPRMYYPIGLLTKQDLRTAPAQIILFAKNTEYVKQIKDDVGSWLKAKYPKNPDDFQLMTNEYRVEQATQGFLLFRIIMGLIVGISVIVGGIGVMNVLLISVTERTREIGIRKAVGANKKHIILQFLSESITVSAFGSMIGFITGVLGTMLVVPIIKSLTKVPFQAAYTWNTFIIIALIAVLIGIVFGTYPAMRASRLDPVEAIRHE